MHRRELLRALAAGAGLRSIDALGLDELLAIGERLHAGARLGAPPSGGLGARLRATTAAAAERIIPATDTPGATDANVSAFIEHMLEHWYEPSDRDRLMAGLRELDEGSRAHGGVEFAALDEEAQRALLSALDAEAAAQRRTPDPSRGGAEHWFATFKFLVVWGYCTSEVAMRRTLGDWPLPGRYDGCAPYTPGQRPVR